MIWTEVKKEKEVSRRGQEGESGGSGRGASANSTLADEGDVWVSGVAEGGEREGGQARQREREGETKR
jgi:hypothetical protein